MKLEYIRYFNHLAKVLSYTKAAQELYITQPTLSMAIRQIEKELDLQLFKRAAGSSRVELTPAGAVLHEYCDLALNNFDTGLRLAHETQGQINSELRVGTIYAMQGYFGHKQCKRLLNSKPIRLKTPLSKRIRLI